jgi:DNA-binding protein HU-beta
MNRTEFVKAVAEATTKTQKEIKEVLEAMQTVAYGEMAKCEEVKIFDGLTLTAVHKEACQKRNPATGAMVDVPAKNAPKAKFGKAAKDAVNA